MDARHGLSAIFAGYLFILAACTPASPDQNQQEPVQALTPAIAPEDLQGLPEGPPAMDVDARPLDDHRVEFTVRTNIPTPVRVAASVDLHGQKDDDVYIGYNEFVTLKAPRTVVVLDTSKADRPLPAARYDATVEFYPRWGAKDNPAAAGVPKLRAVKEFSLSGKGAPVAQIMLAAERHAWVMRNVYINMPWSRSRFERQLGKAIRGRSEQPAALDAYYFPEANMTLLVRRDQNQVLTFREGNAIVPPNASRTSYADRALVWPLTVDEGTIGCTGGAVWFDTIAGKRYAVNGTARTKFPFIEPIWAADKKMSRQMTEGGGASGYVPRIDIDDLLKDGLSRC